MNVRRRIRETIEMPTRDNQQTPKRSSECWSGRKLTVRIEFVKQFHNKRDVCVLTAPSEVTASKLLKFIKTAVKTSNYIQYRVTVLSASTKFWWHEPSKLLMDSLIIISKWRLAQQISFRFNLEDVCDRWERNCRQTSIRSRRFATAAVLPARSPESWKPSGRAEQFVSFPLIRMHGFNITRSGNMAFEKLEPCKT